MNRVGKIDEPLEELPGFVLISAPCNLREAVLEMSVETIEVGMNPDHLEEQRVPQRLLDPFVIVSALRPGFTQRPHLNHANG